MQYIGENGKIWDERSLNNDTWSIPVTSEMVKLAREGIRSIVLTPTKPVPANWFPDKLEEKNFMFGKRWRATRTYIGSDWCRCNCV